MTFRILRLTLGELRLLVSGPHAAHPAIAGVFGLLGFDWLRSGSQRAQILQVVGFVDHSLTRLGGRPQKSLNLAARRGRKVGSLFDEVMQEVLARVVALFVR